MRPAQRLYAATRAAALAVGLGEHVPQLLVRFGFPGLMTRLGVDPPIQPDPALIRMQQLYHTLLRERALEIADRIAASGIEHFFAKGIALLGRVYRPGDRLLADIDLYVRPGDRETTLAILRDLGYAPLPDAEQAGPEVMRSSLTLAREGARDVDQAPVDLHWGLDPVDRLLPRPDRAVPDTAWERLDTDGDLPVPAPGHHAAFLAHHLVHSDLLHVRSLLDLALVLETMPADGGREYASLARSLGISRFATTLAHLVADELDVPRASACADGPRAWNGFTRRLTLVRWLVFVARAPPDADEAITLGRIRRRLGTVGRVAAPTLCADALVPPAAFLRWRWGPRGGRIKHYRQLVRKVMHV